MKQEHIVLAGATGLCGQYVMHLLLAHPQCKQLSIIVRKRIELSHPKLNQIVCDHTNFSSAMIPTTCNRVFCCLGTTIKVAGSQAVFEAVDRHYPVAIARAAYNQGAKHFAIITAISSSPSSKVFYSRVKGLCEQDLQAIGFDSLLILRPSMLLGLRSEKRLAERIGQILMDKFAFLLPARYKAVRAECVAEVMVQEGLKIEHGVRFIESEGIRC